MEKNEQLAEHHHRGLHHPRKNWKWHLLCNLAVAAVVVPFFFWLMRQFERGLDPKTLSLFEMVAPGGSHRRL